MLERSLIDSSKANFGFFPERNIAPLLFLCCSFVVGWKRFFCFDSWI